MRYIIAIFLLFIFLIPVKHFAQQSQLLDSLAGIRERDLRHLLDLRFRGGAGEFERQLLAAVDYTDIARRNCVIGVVILSFTVSCENELGDFKMRNPLGHGLNEQLSGFFETTEDSWNMCTDNRYTRFEIPVAFKFANTQTEARGFITVIGENPGYRCRSDAYFFGRMQRYRDKGRTKKAIEMIDVLIRRDPLNTNYMEIKRALISGQ